MDRQCCREPPPKRLSAVLRNYAADHEVALARHLIAVMPKDAAPSDASALARALFALVSGIGTTSTINSGVFTADQQRAVVRAAVQGLLDEFAQRHGGGGGSTV